MKSSDNSPESWAAQERLRFVERSLFWRGRLKRRDLQAGFGISLAQASGDLQRYFELNPVAARYDMSAKCYRGEAMMNCVLHVPRIEEAMAVYLGEGGGLPFAPAQSESAQIARVSLPVREAALATQRAVFLAVIDGLRLRINYGSLTERSEARWRWICPHAFGHDGYRWHVRAWCEENEDFRDFVISRIRDCDWPTEQAPEGLPADEDWETWETLRFTPESELDTGQQVTIAFDFGLESGELKLKVRRAMKGYLLEHLRLQGWPTRKYRAFFKLKDPSELQK